MRDDIGRQVRVENAREKSRIYTYTGDLGQPLTMVDSSGTRFTVWRNWPFGVPSIEALRGTN